MILTRTSLFSCPPRRCRWAAREGQLSPSPDSHSSAAATVGVASNGFARALEDLHFLLAEAGHPHDRRGVVVW